jgi:hypothetical protein
MTAVFRRRRRRSSSSSSNATRSSCSNSTTVSDSDSDSDSTSNSEESPLSSVSWIEESRSIDIIDRRDSAAAAAATTVHLTFFVGTVAVAVAIFSSW